MRSSNLWKLFFKTSSQKGLWIFLGKGILSFNLCPFFKAFVLSWVLKFWFPSSDAACWLGIFLLERHRPGQGCGASPVCKHACVLRRVWLCNPMDYRQPGSSVHEIFQARMLEWVAIPFCRTFFSSVVRVRFQPLVTYSSRSFCGSAWNVHSGKVRQVRLRGLMPKSPSLSLSCSLETFVVVVIVIQLLSCVRLFAAPWTAGCQASLSFTISQTLLRFMSILSKHLILCRPLLFLPSIFPSIFPRRHILILLSSQLYINILR